MNLGVWPRRDPHSQNQWRITLSYKVLDRRKQRAILIPVPDPIFLVCHSMQNLSSTSPADAIRQIFADSLRFWELRRLFYNLVLFTVVVTWVAATWPHFRPMIEVHSLLLLAILALLANACYCAAYLVDIPLQCSALNDLWRRRRWILWVVGTLLAILLANYWIADEIYPFVR